MNFFSPLAVVSLVLLHAASALGGPVVIFESGTLRPGETLDLDITIFDDDETGYSEFAFESFITQTAGSGQGLSFDISGPDFWLDHDYIFFEKTGTGSDGLPFVNVTSTLPDADDTYSVSDEAFPRGMCPLPLRVKPNCWLLLASRQAVLPPLVTSSKSTFPSSTLIGTVTVSRFRSTNFRVEP